MFLKPQSIEGYYILISQARLDEACHTGCNTINMVLFFVIVIFLVSLIYQT